MSPDRELEELLKVLVERFGAGRSLGEVYATTYFLRVLRGGETPSLADVSAATGISKQNLSRWLKYQIEIGQAITSPTEDDGRKYQIDITDPDWAYRHLAQVAEILGCDISPSPSSRSERGC